MGRYPVAEADDDHHDHDHDHADGIMANPSTPPRQQRFIYLDQHQARDEVEAWHRTLLPWPGGLVPREKVYARYREFCASRGLESTTVSGFGRMVYRVFPDLTSRRIGTRPNTKMNYANVRLASSDEARPPGSVASLRRPRPSASSPTSPPSSTNAAVAAASPAPRPTPTRYDGRSSPFDAPPAFISPLGVTASEPARAPGIPQWRDDEQDELFDFLAGEPSPQELSSSSPPPASATATTTTTTTTTQPDSSESPLRLEAWSAFGGMVRAEGYGVDPRAHPWVALPILPSLELIERSTSDDPAHVAQLARAIEHFLVTHDSTALEEAGNRVLHQFNTDPYDVTAYDCLFVRVVAQSARGAEEKNESEQKNEDETEMKERGITEVVRHSVTAVLLNTLRSLTSQGDPLHTTRLAQTLDRVRLPSVMALCLHELDSRDLLETALHMLPFAFPDDSPGLHLLLHRLVEMVRPFPAVHTRMTDLLPAFAPRSPT